MMGKLFNPLNLCIDARPLQNAHSTRGIGVFLKNLLVGLVTHTINDEVTLLTLRGKKLRQIFKKERRSETRRLERPNRFNWIADQLFLPKIVEQVGADIFFATDINSYLLPQPGLKIVSMAYDLIPFIFPQVMTSQPFSVRVGWNVNFRKLPQSDAIITISEATKNDLIHFFGISPAKITVIYPGMDHLLFNKANAENVKRQNHVLEQYGIEGKFILYVGDSEWRKNLRRVLEAFTTLDCDVRLVLVGKRAKTDTTLFGWIRELGLDGRVITPGYVADEDLPPLYGAAEVFIFPSLYEGFGLPV
ncbi:MAG: glycosyltransferase family 1 protein, partial [Desulfuromonadales bacterium]